MSSESPATITSGSSNQHARKAPSASERWTKCTASIAFETANADKVFVQALGRVRDLVPYLKTINSELYDHERRAIQIVEDLDNGEIKLKKLTAEQKKDILRSEGKVYTREGTRAHDFAAKLFADEIRIDDIPEVFRKGVLGYVQHCYDLVPGEDDEHYVEVEVPLWYSPGDKGTSDFIGIRRSGDSVTVFGRDLKWGDGKLVRNFENTQFAIYVRSVIEQWEEEGFASFPPDTIVNMAAYQPNHRQAGEIEPWILTLADLRAFTQGIEDAAKQIDSGEGLVFCPEPDVCQWCECKSFCEARLKAATEALEVPDSLLTGDQLLALLPDNDEIPGHKPRTATSLNKLDPETRTTKRIEFVAGVAGEDMDWVLGFGRLVRLWAKKSIIVSLLDDIGDYLREEMLAGNPELGEFLKLVESKQGDRKWKDEEATAKLLKQRLKIDEYMPRSLASVATIEKLIDLEKESTKFKNLWASLITRSAAGLTIATLDDNRQAVSRVIDLLPDEEEEDLGFGDLLDD